MKTQRNQTLCALLIGWENSVATVENRIVGLRKQNKNNNEAKTKKQNYHTIHNFNF